MIVLYFFLVDRSEVNPVSKKKKSKSSQNVPVPKKESNTKNIIIFGLVALIVAVSGVIAFQFSKTTTESAETQVSMRRGETRPTLSPALFSDPFVAETYRMAKEVPEVFDSLFCYCYCDKDPFHHVSLLSCFVDKHAAG